MSSHEGLDPQRREYEERARVATALGGEAFERLLGRATRADTGQARKVARFIATVVGRASFDVYDLRAFDAEISDDILLCMDAIRWGKLHLPDLVPNGMQRAESVCRDWGYA